MVSWRKRLWKELDEAPVVFHAFQRTADFLSVGGTSQIDGASEDVCQIVSVSQADRAYDILDPTDPEKTIRDFQNPFNHMVISTEKAEGLYN
jgi:hypothetical protein